MPAVAGLRPTPDRVRESLFNWLGQDLTGLVCLDLFAGSGALGLEAASRGAGHVTLVEQDRRVASVLRLNMGVLGAERLELVRADALQFLAANHRHYDLVFLDPPYHRAWLDRVAPLLHRALAPRALVYAEAEEPVERIANCGMIKQGQAGQVHYQLLQAQS